MAASVTAAGRSLTRHGYGPVLFSIVGVAVIVLAIVRGSATGGPAPDSGGQQTLTGRAGGTTSAPPPPSGADISAYIVRDPGPAPAIDLLDPDGAPFSLASLRGHDVLVFFGYTHCPDVCPATIGTVGAAIRAAPGDVRAVFVTIDPARDTQAWLREYRTVMPAAFTPVTGTDAAIAATAAAWHVRYARVDGNTPEAYAMAHTADVFLVDRDGVLRGDFPFGTSDGAMTATIAAVDAAGRFAGASPVGEGSFGPGARETPAATSATTSPFASFPVSRETPGPLDLQVTVVSTSVWAGAPSGVILRLSIDGRPVDDVDANVRVRVEREDGADAGSPVDARAVRPPGVDRTSFVADIVVPSPGPWRLDVTAQPGGVPISTSVPIDVRDPGTTPALGSGAPTVHTPTVADAGGDLTAVTTDPAPDPRLSTTSTTGALAAHRPFVLVIDSTKFRVTSACGKAIVLARYLLDRWPDVAFIHLEPYRYSVVSDTPVLDGTLDDPQLTDPAAAWGIGGAPWGPRSMPWVFVVDANGVVRAKAQGVIGTDDVDVVLAELAPGG